MNGETDAALARFVLNAYERAPAVRDILDNAAIAPSTVTSRADLSRVPVTPKEHLLELQRQRPPFGGFLGVELSAVSHVYVSAGPIYEPAARPGHGFGAAIAAAGVGPGDVVLNTWSYHLVPAGLVLDEAFRSVGATVIPAGTGNSALLSQVIIEMGVTVVAASTAFFEKLIEQITDAGHVLPRDWKVRLAYLGAEFGDWPAKRRRLESRYDIGTFSFYGTGEIGLIGIECEARDGYHIVPEVLVDICDPSSGVPLPNGAVGEVVATSLCDVWPLIRFGTGDVSSAAAAPCVCGQDSPKIGSIAGRVGQAIKVREIFVYPRHLEELVRRVPEVLGIQGSVVRRAGRDEVDLSVVADDGADHGAVGIRVAEVFAELTRLRPGVIEFVAKDSLSADGPLLSNVRDSEDGILDRLLEVLAERVPEPSASLESQRRQFEAMTNKAPLADLVRIDRTALGRIPAERLVPHGAASTRSILWFHGGGYCIGSLNTVRPLASRIAEATRTPVITVDYRLAPENAFPAALEDAVEAYRALLSQTSHRDIAVGGDSAGGGLAVALMVALKQQDIALPAAAICLSPWADLSMTAESYDSPDATDPQAARWQLEAMAQAYLAGVPAETPLASPIRGDLHGLPPLLIQAGAGERLLDDATDLARAAESAGVSITLECWERMPHVWHAFAPKLPQAVRAIDALAAWLSATWDARAPL